MQGVLVQLVGAGQLHHVAQVHHGDAVGDVLDDVQIVGDEQVGQAQLLLQIVKQVDNLGLDGHVQGGDGLVADDEFRLDGQGPGNADALALAAGELVGEAVGVLPVEAHHLQQLVDALLAALLIVHLVDDHALLDDGGNRHAGVQRGVGVLENNLGLFGVGKAVFGVLQVHLFALVRELAKSGRVDAHGHTAQGGLAAAGLAHQAHGLALVDVKGDVVHGFQGAAGNLKVFADVL